MVNHWERQQLYRIASCRVGRPVIFVVTSNNISKTRHFYDNLYDNLYTLSLFALKLWLFWFLWLKTPWCAKYQVFVLRSAASSAVSDSWSSIDIPFFKLLSVSLSLLNCTICWSDSSLPYFTKFTFTFCEFEELGSIHWSKHEPSQHSVNSMWFSCSPLAIFFRYLVTYV